MGGSQQSAIFPIFCHDKQRYIQLFLLAREPFPIIFQMVLWQLDSPRPSVDGQAKPRRVRRGRCFGNNYHLLPSLVAGLRSSAQTLRASSTLQHMHVWHSGICTRLASVDAVIVLGRVAAAMFGFVVESFLQVIHASLAAWAESGSTPSQRQRPEFDTYSVCLFL